MTIVFDFLIFVQQIFRNPLKIAALIVYGLVLILMVKMRKNFFGDLYTIFPGKAVDSFAKIWIGLFGLFLFLLFVEILGAPHNNFLIRRKLQKIGLKNRIGEVPMLLHYQKKKKFQVYTFSTVGIPLEDWEAHKEDIEASLNVEIISMEYSKGHTQIEINFVSAKEALPSKIDWTEELLERKNKIIKLGVGYTGDVCWDLDSDAHALIGGITGSGKTVLLKNVLHQMIEQGAKVYVADFKGGIDYSGPIWHRDVIFMDRKDKVIDYLDEIIEEKKRREQLFIGSSVKKLSEYNEITMNPLPHIVFACDELAELLDTTGLSKEEKAVVQGIDSRLSTLARLGRAFGIHLVLATQRPDANIIRGQIKNNMNLRICGKADQVLSQIILDNTSASTEIRGCQKGRFIMDDGTVFQGYWDEEV